MRYLSSLIAAGAGVTLSNQEDVLAAADTTTSTTYVASSLAITIPNVSGGLTLCIAVMSVSHDVSTGWMACVLSDDGTELTGNQQLSSGVANSYDPMTLTSIVSSDGSSISVEFRSNAGGTTATIGYAAAIRVSKLVTLEIS